MNKFLYNIKSGNHNDVCYYNQIDFIKAIAITSVIILHTVPSDILLFTIFAPFHIWHAVPVFIMIAGINSTLSIYKRGHFSLSYEYSLDKYIIYFKRILIPFSIVWLFQIFVLILAKKATLGKIFYLYVTGGLGPGGYFTPLFIQHLILFPTIIWLKNKFSSYNQFTMLAGFFLVSVFLEWMCIILNIPEWLYRLLYLRYLFAAVIGTYIVSHGFSKKVFLLITPISVIYIICVSYLNYNLPIIYSAWNFQHAPAYFYTALLVFCLWRIYPLFRGIENYFLPIGKASYHIFLFQMIWFWKFARFLRKLVTNDLLYLTLNIFICLLVGYAFYTIQMALTKRYSSSKIIQSYA